MKDFELTKDMLSLGGVFYPRGYAFIMFPSEQEARQAADELQTYADDIMLLTPAAIVSQIGHADDQSNMALPSAGTEGATVRKYVDLARQGHHALMIPARSDEATEQVMSVVRKRPFSYAQKYHLLAMEDLE
jgi:hypothetical protein